MNATRWRIPPDSAAGRAALELAQPEALEQRRRPLARVAPGDALRLQRERRVAERVAPRQQQVALRHQRARRQPRRRAGVATDRDGPAVGLLQPGDQLQQRRLAAARRADDPQHLAGPDREIQPVERDHLAPTPRAARH